MTSGRYLIDRQAAIDKVQAIERLATLPDNDAVIRVGDVESVLFDLPSAEPEQKKGEWIEKEVIHKDENKEIIEEWQSAKCSVCGKYHTTQYIYYFDDYAFCPNCGHPMKGRKDNDSERMV